MGAVLVVPQGGAGGGAGGFRESIPGTAVRIVIQSPLGILQQELLPVTARLSNTVGGGGAGGSFISAEILQWS